MKYYELTKKGERKYMRTIYKYRAVYVNTETMERRQLNIAVNGNKEERYKNMNKVFHEATYNMKKNEIIEKINLWSVMNL